jgi:hypothetical protein
MPAQAWEKQTLPQIPGGNLEELGRKGRTGSSIVVYAWQMLRAHASPWGQPERSEGEIRRGLV